MFGKLDVLNQIGCSNKVLKDGKACCCPLSYFVRCSAT